MDDNNSQSSSDTELQDPYFDDDRPGCSLNPIEISSESDSSEDLHEGSSEPKKFKLASCKATASASESSDTTDSHLGTQTIKVCSLNVSGLQKCLATKTFKHFLKQHDVLCFTETNTAEGDKIMSLYGYKRIDHHRKQVNTKRPKKSGGICIYVCDRLTKFLKEEIDSPCEYILWIRIEDLLLGAVYIPPSTSYFSKEKLLCEFEMDVSSKCRGSKHVILTGDFNSRTAEFRDYIQYDKDNQYGILKQLNIPLKRSSTDKKTINYYGARLLETCQDNNLLMLNGRFSYNKDIGKCTFFKKYEGKKTRKTLIDYTIATVESFKLLKSFDVITEGPEFSDHYPLVFELEYKI